MKKYLIYILLFYIIVVGIVVVLIKEYPNERREIGQKLLSIVQKKVNDKTVGNDLVNQVLPPGGVKIPVKLNRLGVAMVQTGVIDKSKIDALYAKRGLKAGIDRLLTADEPNIIITKENADLYLNYFWALGLGNKNSILTQGPMVRNHDPGDFASTSGWTLVRGKTMDHYAKHEFINLTFNQQKMTEEISKNIYRPCCDNSTYFPDCNHGMAMLGFIELAASQGLSEKEIYRDALALNSFWFPNNYLTIAQYFRENNIDWAIIKPKDILSKVYSSNQGYADISSKIKNPPLYLGGGACGI